MNRPFRNRRAAKLDAAVTESEGRLLSSRRTQASAEQLLARIRAAHRVQPLPAAPAPDDDDPLLPDAAFDQVLRHMFASQLAVRQSADALYATDSGLSGYLASAIRELSAACAVLQEYVLPD
jgi:hypothetical protein